MSDGEGSRRHGPNHRSCNYLMSINCSKDLNNSNFKTARQMGKLSELSTCGITFHLSMNLFLPVKVGIELVSKRTTGVIESQLLINAIDLFNIFRSKLKVSFQVRLYAGWRLGFREDGVSFCDAPCEGYLCAGFVVFFADFNEHGVVLYISQLVWLLWEE
jgi:hypothetical protein